MYDPITSALLFVILVPGVVLSIGTGVVAALIHGAVFYFTQNLGSALVPWWVVWAVAILVVGWRLSNNSSY
jgi:hypothetical protein